MQRFVLEKGRIGFVLFTFAKKKTLILPCFAASIYYFSLGFWNRTQCLVGFCVPWYLCFEVFIKLQTLYITVENRILCIAHILVIATF